MSWKDVGIWEPYDYYTRQARDWGPLRKAASIGYYDPRDLTLEVGDWVVVNTPLGTDLGTAVVSSCALVHRDPMIPVRPAMRAATEDDLAQRESLKVREAEALGLARAKARILGLQMKFSAAHIALDERKLVLEFNAAERLELRDLDRSLGDALRMRIELRAVGPRDAAKNVGGMGRCGLELCCTSWLDKFESVSVPMAKEQALPISAEGLAGQCGRLKCCLRFEYEQYRAANKMLSRQEERVRTPEGTGRVIVGHPRRETVSVALDRRNDDDYVRTIEISIAEIERLPKPQPQR